MQFARRTGNPNVDQMLANMTATEAAEWMYFNRIEPFPEDKIIQTIARIAAIFANGTLKRKDKQGWKDSDFIPTFGLEFFKKRDTKRIAANLKRAFGGLLKGNGKKEKRIPYFLEGKVPKRTTLPKRLQKLKNKKD